MKAKFQQATADQSGTEPQSQLTIVCSFESALYINPFLSHFALLEDLSDAQKAGHKVIITSRMIEGPAAMLPFYVEEAVQKGFYVLPSTEFTLMGKQELAKNPIHVDYVIDNKPIAKQEIYDDETDELLPPYANPVHQLSIDDKGNLSPLGRAQFRAALGLKPLVNVIIHTASPTLQ